MNEQNQGFVYLTIPKEYICIFNKIMIHLASLGKDLLDDCSASCKPRNRLITDCWNTFQLAVSNKLNGNEDRAKYFIDYIEKQLSNLSNFPDLGLDLTLLYQAIDEHGYLKSTIDCKTKILFFVNPDTGYLYKINYNDYNNDKFYIENNNLIVKYNKQKYERVYTKSW